LTFGKVAAARELISQRSNSDNVKEREMFFLFLIQSIFAVDDSAANSLIQQEIQRSKSS